MSIVTLIFAIVFVVPLIGFIFSILWKDKRKRTVGFLVASVLVVFALVVSYYVNRGK